MDFAMEFDILLKEESLRYQGTLRATIKMEKNVQSRNPVSSLLSIIIYYYTQQNITYP